MIDFFFLPIINQVIVYLYFNYTYIPDQFLCRKEDWELKKTQLQAQQEILRKSLETLQVY